MMIAHSTRSRARRIAGIGLATILVGVGLGLTASGSIASPSQIAPKSVKPLLQAHPDPAPAPMPTPEIVIADRTPQIVMRTSDDDQADGPVSSVAPVAPVAAVAPVAPVAALSPLPPLPPVPPIAMNARLTAEQRAALHEAARKASEQARQAGEAARQAVANINFAAISQDAMAQARAELERTCTHATPASPGETDSQAISRLALGCVDMAAINREVQDSLREAMEEIRHDRDLSDAERARALAEIDKTRAEMAHRFTQ